MCLPRLYRRNVRNEYNTMTLWMRSMVRNEDRLPICATRTKLFKMTVNYTLNESLRILASLPWPESILFPLIKDSLFEMTINYISVLSRFWSVMTTNYSLCSFQQLDTLPIFSHPRRHPIQALERFFTMQQIGSAAVVITCIVLVPCIRLRPFMRICSEASVPNHKLFSMREQSRPTAMIDTNLHWASIDTQVLMSDIFAWQCVSHNTEQQLRVYDNVNLDHDFAKKTLEAKQLTVLNRLTESPRIRHVCQSGDVSPQIATLYR